MHKMILYMKNGSTVSTETEAVDQTVEDLRQLMNTFHRRGIFRATNSTVILRGNPIVCVPIENINFFTFAPVESDPTKTR